MAINKQTIISAFDDKLTLLQWLKTINKALDEAVLTGVEVRQKGNATYSFVVTFEDGTELESNEFVLAQGESINGATIRNGHLYLSLTNGDELDAGNVKPVTSFDINASQHLIVNYGDGTSQDLGAIFSGNVNVDGNFTANSIIENMSGYSFTPVSSNGYNLQYVYVGVVKNGNKLTCAIALNVTKTDDSIATSNVAFCYLNLPSTIMDKLHPVEIGGLNFLSVYKLNAFSENGKSVEINGAISKSTNAIAFASKDIKNALIQGTKYYVRFEATFLLSDSLAV